MSALAFHQRRHLPSHRPATRRGRRAAAPRQDGVAPQQPPEAIPGHGERGVAQLRRRGPMGLAVDGRAEEGDLRVRNKKRLSVEPTG